MTTTISPTTNGTRSMPSPLGVLPDMAPSWRNLAVDYDVAAHTIVEAHAKDGQADDVPVLDLRTWGVVPLDGKFGLAPLARHHAPMPMRATAFSNLMAKLNAPADFVRDRLPMPLQLATTNWLLQQQERAVPSVLRTRAGELTALVSDRYAPLDAEELFQVVRDVLVQQDALDRVEVKSIATGVVDVMRLVFPAETAAVKVGDVTALGIDISSSSFGKSAVHIRGLLWRLRCTNGLRVAEGAGAYSFRHVGDVDRLKACIADAIPSALVIARGTLGRWKQAVDVMVEKVAEQIAQLGDLTHAERELVEAEVTKEAGVHALPEHVDLYSFLNGITAAAREAVPARRIEIEGLAGRLLDQRMRTS